MQNGEQELELAGEQTLFSKPMAALLQWGGASSSLLMLITVVQNFQRGQAWREAEPGSQNHLLHGHSWDESGQPH